MTLVNAETGEVVAHSLAECEQIIERGLTTFIEVGQALMEIRDGRLYRETHSDFDSYCQQRWGWNRAHAYRMIGAAEVVEDVSPIGDIAPPANEAQARPLTKLPTPEERREAWGDANRRAAEEERPVTARDVEDAVSELKRGVEKAAQLRDGIADAKEAAAKLREDFPDVPPADPELARQRGEFMRLCRDLVAIGNGTAFLARHADLLRPDHLALAAEARDWLDDLIDQWRAA